MFKRFLNYSKDSVGLCTDFSCMILELELIVKLHSKPRSLWDTILSIPRELMWSVWSTCCGYTAATAVVSPKTPLLYFVHCCGPVLNLHCCRFVQSTLPATNSTVITSVLTWFFYHKCWIDLHLHPYYRGCDSTRSQQELPHRIENPWRYRACLTPNIYLPKCCRHSQLFGHNIGYQNILPKWQSRPCTQWLCEPPEDEVQPEQHAHTTM